MVDTPEPPDTLHHYTTAAGLLGIVEPVRFGATVERSDFGQQSRVRSISLWATDARYLNDSAELRFAAPALADMLEKHSASLEHYRVLQIEDLASRLRAGNFVGDGPAAGLPHTAYVTSFCRHGDLLSQWRGYGASGGGYSIEFRTDALKEMRYPIGRADNDEIGFFSGSAIQEVLYGPDEDELATAAESIVKSDHYVSDMSAAVAWLARFKDPAFVEEDEWRLIWSAATDSMPRRFRPSATGTIVPYIQLHRLHWNPQQMPLTGLSAIKSITVGPGPDKSLRKESVLQLMRQRGFTDIEVHESKVPFKG